MKVAVISDVHGNRHALEAVLADAHDAKVGAVWCLGDLVGYGADPNDCVQLVLKSSDICLAGNHDLAVTGEISLDEFSAGAAIAARWTREVLREENLEALKQLEPSDKARGIGLFHASPRDPIWEYVVSSLLAELCFTAATETISLIGHSHVALSFVKHEGELATGEPRRNNDTISLVEGQWLLNPGSVGQPRDNDPRAAWLLLDAENRTAQWRRVEYDVAGAQAAIRSARLPESLAERLEYGQ
ncbi:MAG TPA: metallophosphoesterase family protein [Baekduia sp.]|nr:metallophosphoesterase family protein [Baekduia sp.]